LFHLGVGLVIVVEVAVDVALIEGGGLRDGLARRGDQLVGRRRHVESGRELPEHPTVRLGQIHQDIDQFRFLSLGQGAA
jgi:hypothetical protein